MMMMKIRRKVEKNDKRIKKGKENDENKNEINTQEYLKIEFGLFLIHVNNPKPPKSNVKWAKEKRKRKEREKYLQQL